MDETELKKSINIFTLSEVQSVSTPKPYLFASTELASNSKQ